MKPTVCLFSILLLTGCFNTIEISVGSEKFSVEVARTEKEKQKGLMNRKSLGKREGMLFVYTRDQQLSFWMKNTLIPLSIAFILADGTIVQIEDMEPQNVIPVNSRYSVRYALEVKQGVFRDLGIKPGDRVIFPENF